MDADLKEHLEGMEERFNTKMERVETSLLTEFQKSEERIIEAVRGMQTELLRGFEAFSGSQNIRIRKVEADQTNSDTALSGRVTLVEQRLHEIEMRLLRPPSGAL